MSVSVDETQLSSNMQKYKKAQKDLSKTYQKEQLEDIQCQINKIQIM